MARKLRAQYPGANYHVLNRGDRREPIFRDDEDRQRLLTTRAALQAPEVRKKIAHGVSRG